MSLSPEESQKLTNLQQRILMNISQGKPASQDIAQEDLKSALDLIRGDRSKALQAGTAKAPRKSRAAPASAQSSLSLEEKLRARGLGKSLD